MTNWQPEHLDMMRTLERQVEALDKEPMSPVERQLANAILVLLDILAEAHPAND